MKRRVVTLDEVREYVRNTYGECEMDAGICALVDVDDMGFCRDNVTRWYKFTLNEVPCIYFKH